MSVTVPLAWLREIEWSARSPYVPDVRVCPECNGREYEDHQSDCRLREYIREGERQSVEAYIRDPDAELMGQVDMVIMGHLALSEEAVLRIAMKKTKGALDPAKVVARIQELRASLNKENS